MEQARVSRLMLRALVLWCPLAAAQPTPWSVSVRVEDAAGTAALSGEYRLIRDPKLAVSANGALERPAAGITSLAQALSARYGFSLAERPAALSVSYGVRRNWLGASGLDLGQSGAFDLGWQPTPAAGMGVFGSLSRSNFDQDGADARLDSQDAATRRVGIRGSLAFDDRRQALQGSVSYADNDAEGANFVSRAAATTLQYTHLLPRRWSLVAGADYTRTRYTEFAADPDRESALYGCRLALQGPLLQRLTASLAYALSRLTWNQDPYVRQESVLLSLSYRL